LRNFILTWRQQNNSYSNADTDITLAKDDDYFEFPYSLWKFFYDIYGCRPIIVVKYFSPSDGILPSIYKDLNQNMSSNGELSIEQKSLFSDRTII